MSADVASEREFAWKHKQAKLGEKAVVQVMAEQIKFSDESKHPIAT